MELTKFFSQLISYASPYLPYLLVLILISAVALIIFLLYKSRKYKNSQSETEEPFLGFSKEKVLGSLTQFPSLVTMKQNFREGLNILKGAIPGRNYQYKVPWYLMIGGPGSGKSTLLENTGLDLPLGVPEQIQGTRNGFNWWFFNQGVVLDVDSDYFKTDEAVDPELKDWVAFLQTLLQSRANRPVDGVVITFSARDLLDPKISESERAKRAGEKAAGFYDRLMTAQKILGMRLPIYVLITQCDHIPGFKGFCRALPGPMRDDIFGWSNPYSLEKGYAPHWVDEAFQSLDKDLHQAQTKVLANDVPPQDQDGVFLFPGEVLRLKESLRAVLDNLFRKTVYRESFYFRGFYFCGNAGAPLEQGSDKPENFKRLASQTQSRIQQSFFFLKDLFEKKIFQESRLGRPVAQVFRWRKRTTWFARLAVVTVALVWGLGMWSSYHNLDKDKHELMNYLVILENVLKQSDTRQAKHRDLDGKFNKDALTLLNAWASVNNTRFQSIFFPASWSGYIDKHIEKTMIEAYDTVIVDNLALNLKSKAKKILSGTGDKGGIGESSIVGFGSPQSELEFIKLKDVANSIVELQNNMELFNGFKSSTDLVGLGKVVKYVHGVTLPKRFYKNARHYHKALRRIDDNQIDLSEYEKVFALVVENQAVVWLDELFSDNRLELTLGRYTKFIKQLDSRRQLSRVRLLPEHKLKVLLEKTQNLKEVVSSPEFFWMRKGELEAAPELDKLLKNIEASSFLGKELGQRVKHSINRRIEDLHKRLISYESHLTGPYLFRKDKSVEMELSEDLQSIEDLLVDYFEESFTVDLGDSNDLIVDLSSDSKVLWNTNLLSQGIQLYNQYIQFTQNDLLKFPEELRHFIKRSAKEKLEVNIIDQLSKAQQVYEHRDEFDFTRPENDLVEEIKNFKANINILAKLMDILHDLDYMDSSRTVFNLILSQSFKLLETVDRLFEKENPYSFRGNNFSWWEGDVSISLAAFDADDEEELKYALSTQRDRIQRLAREYVKPLLGFLVTRTESLPQEEQELVSKWQRIIQELDKYEAKKQHNSLAALESFIVFKLNKITLKNCLDELKVKAPPKMTANFFSGTLIHLKQKLIDRCRAFDKDKGTKAYDKVEEFFNKKLAGKFPFAKLADGPIGNEAKLKDINEFFKLFDAYVKEEFVLWEQARRIGDSVDDQVFNFVNQMRQVRQFLQPFGETSKQGPVYLIEPEFRVNRELEALGSEVIEWKIETREGISASQLDKEKLLPWNQADPLRVSFRWAKNSPHAPVSVGDWDGFRVKDRTAIFEYKNQWPLIHLLARQEIGAFDLTELGDLKPNTLKFVIDISQKQQTVLTTGEKHQVTGSPALKKAKLFVRLVVKSSDKKEIFEFPVFPISAPQVAKDSSAGSS